MSILSINSHVVYGSVGNKATIYPLMHMGYEVWPLHTAQFSRHAGYNTWAGEAFSEETIRCLLESIIDDGVAKNCKAIISGYMGSDGICIEVFKAVERLKKQNSNILYLCDPVIGNSLAKANYNIINFFQTNLNADVCTPNQCEAEVISGIKIERRGDLDRIAEFFCNKVATLIITGIQAEFIPDNKLGIFVSSKKSQNLILTDKYDNVPINGTGDLFAAIFLGKYLLTKDAIMATKNAIYLTDLVIKQSVMINSQELVIQNINYRT